MNPQPSEYDMSRGHTEFNCEGIPRLDCAKCWREILPTFSLPPRDFFHSWLYYGDAEIQAAMLEARRWEARQNNRKQPADIARVISNILRKKKELTDAEVQRRAYQGASNEERTETR